MSRKMDEELRAKVRGARKKRGWTQGQMAAKARMSLRAYQGFENEESWPQPANMRAILAALDLTTDPTDDPAARWSGQDSGDIGLFLSTLGTYLEGLDDRERVRFITEETVKIMARLVQSQVETDEQKARRLAAERRPGSQPVDTPRRNRASGG